MTSYYARGKRVAETNAGIYGDEWVCTMPTPERAKWMAEQLNKAQAVDQRKEHVVQMPLTVKVWAFDEADALRQASQAIGTGFPQVYGVKEVIGQPAAKAV